MWFIVLVLPIVSTLTLFSPNFLKTSPSFSAGSFACARPRSGCCRKNNRRKENRDKKSCTAGTSNAVAVDAGNAWISLKVAQAEKRSLRLGLGLQKGHEEPYEGYADAEEYEKYCIHQYNLLVKKR